ncbi:T9SS type A sorting domain-containing protein [Maribellus mangrovi]|uniref:T9SS type A sorting domain-containing protein n=1 Tax=Maribellus mangrovi TaxID=3133146 RepID=UPI0030EB55B7
MKHTLLLVLTICLLGFVKAQENTWEVYLQGEAVKSIAFEKENVWLATGSHLVRLNKLDKSTTYYSYPYLDEKGSSYKVKADKYGVIWLARSEYLPSGGSIYENYNSSIYSFDGKQWRKITTLGYGEISSLAIDKNNNKWIAKAGSDGLYKIIQDSCIQFTPQNSELVYDHVDQVVSDNEGNIWVANSGNYSGLISADLVLMKIDGDNWDVHFSGTGTWALLNIGIDSHESLWVQQLFALNKLDTVSDSWTEQINIGSLDAQEYPHFYAVEGERKIWCSRRLKLQEKGIAVYENSNWIYYTTSNSELPSNTVNQIAIDADGTKWIATENGLASLKLATSLSMELSAEEQSFSFYPNPTNDFLILKIPQKMQNYTVEIVNINGQVLQSYNLNSNEKRLNVSNLTVGVYLLRIQSDEHQVLKKFVKQ